MNIKVLFSDLDGTLVKHSGDITEDAVKTVRKLLDNKIDVVLVSGRHTDMMRSIHHNIGLKTPVIGCNGGVIKDLNTNEVLYTNPLSKDIVKKTIYTARELGVDWAVYEKNNIMFEKMPPKSYRLPYINAQLPKHLQANFLKIDSLDDMFEKDYVFLKALLLFDNKMEAIDKGREMLSKLEGIDVVQSASTYLDVMVHGSSKGQAIKRYLELKNIDRDETAAIGDAQNDIDMIEYSGFGIAMGNAVDSIKKIADYTTTPHPYGFEDAVDYLLKRCV
ncbi:HAD family hydrolase [Herbivorax sp. ANBcel31]|uniref:HAD family hydrolase n=1 Tax=Herbivorax sp. ANBcel31 TaxID=3069754 RepID=UPI0027B1885F|nr:HAD family hydrolase [Herbivorax sp. ANBcel31]MDQ2087870.1 HAD family hydrolase [Herbivorax sp. ANBcel31]